MCGKGFGDSKGVPEKSPHFCCRPPVWTRQGFGYSPAQINAGHMN